MRRSSAILLICLFTAQCCINEEKTVEFHRELKNLKEDSYYIDVVELSGEILNVEDFDTPIPRQEGCFLYNYRFILDTCTSKLTILSVKKDFNKFIESKSNLILVKYNEGIVSDYSLCILDEQKVKIKKRFDTEPICEVEIKSNGLFVFIIDGDYKNGIIECAYNTIWDHIFIERYSVKYFNDVEVIFKDINEKWHLP